jgi:hypothetical protein
LFFPKQAFQLARPLFHKSKAPAAFTAGALPFALANFQS